MIVLSSDSTDIRLLNEMIEVKIKQAGVELCQAKVKLEVIVEAELYLELNMKRITASLCGWVG